MGAAAWCLGSVGTLAALTGCGPKQTRLPLPDDKAILVGMDEERSAQEQESQVRGQILSVDGQSVKNMKERYLDAGCHILEVEVEYRITRPDRQPCVAFKAFGACDRVASYESGRQHFALPMQPRRRYELSARINEDGAWVYFVEVDPELGTVARFTPVHPGTTACTPGVSL